MTSSEKNQRIKLLYCRILSHPFHPIVLFFYRNFRVFFGGFGQTVTKYIDAAFILSSEVNPIFVRHNKFIVEENVPTKTVVKYDMKLDEGFIKCCKFTSSRKWEYRYRNPNLH